MPQEKNKHWYINLKRPLLLLLIPKYPDIKTNTLTPTPANISRNDIKNVCDGFACASIGVGIPNAKN